jgi:UDP-N-acetylmuramoylalanine-D-glutamate ligase
MKITMLGADGITGKAVTDKISRLPQHRITDIKEADIVVTSPGIPPDQYPRTDKPIISEIELAWLLLQECSRQPKIVAITEQTAKPQSQRW